MLLILNLLVPAAHLSLYMWPNAATTATKGCSFKPIWASWSSTTGCVAQQTGWLSPATGAIRRENACGALPFLAWLGLIKAFCWNKVIIHLAISQFPHNYPPASWTLTCTNAHIHTLTYSHQRSDKNTFPLWFVSLLRGKWLKGFRVGLLVTA